MPSAQFILLVLMHCSALKQKSADCRQLLIHEVQLMLFVELAVMHKISCRLSHRWESGFGLIVILYFTLILIIRISFTTGANVSRPIFD